MGYCGQLREYKKIDLAIEAFLRHATSNTHLLIAGKPTDKDLVARLEYASKQDPRIHLHANDLSLEDFEAALVACDTIIYPSRNYLHSGSLVHALSAGCHLLTPTTPFSQSLLELLGPSCVTTYNTDDKLPLLLSTPEKMKGPISSSGMQELDPERVADNLMEFVKKLNTTY